MYIKPTLSRVDALASEIDQYAQLVDNIVYMVKDIDVMRYKDIGFRDDKEAHRRVGGNANIVLFSEKIGHQALLSEIRDKYNVSILALGGQPSVLTSEYFVDTLKKQGVNLQRSFYLFSIVDYDTSGWIIRNAFLDNLKFYGISHSRVIDLVHPDMLTPEEIKLARYKIPKSEVMKAKNKTWLKEAHKRNYKNQRYLEETKRGERVLYGLEAESVSAKRLTAKLEEVMVPLIGKSEDLLKIHELQQLDTAIKTLIIHKLT